MKCNCGQCEIPIENKNLLNPEEHFGCIKNFMNYYNININESEIKDIGEMIIKNPLYPKIKTIIESPRENIGMPIFRLDKLKAKYEEFKIIYEKFTCPICRILLFPMGQKQKDIIYDKILEAINDRYLSNWAINEVTNFKQFWGVRCDADSCPENFKEFLTLEEEKYKLDANIHLESHLIDIVKYHKTLSH